MRKTCLFSLVFVLFLIAFSIAFAAPEDVSLIPLSRYNYKNIDGYGWYDKCADTSWFGFVLYNGTNSTYYLEMPSEARVTGWNGTRHPLKNFRYTKVGTDIVNFLPIDRTGTPFSGDLKLPVKTAYAIFLDVTDFSAYNLYWDTNVFFTIHIKDANTSAAKNITGILAQRGNACSADQVCSADLISGSYYSNGSGEVIVHIKNNMPDTAQVTARTNADISWVDASGKKQSRSVEKAVVWNKQPGWMGSGSERTISGQLSLPVEITAAAEELNITFHFSHPSSFFYGNFETTAALKMVSGLQGAITGNYEADGSGGSFTAILNNHQDTAVSVTLPANGLLKSANGQTTPITLSWAQSGTVNLSAQSTKELKGNLIFSDTSLIHANSSLIISAEAEAEGTTGTIAGTITRNPDPNPVLTSVGFCRDYTADENKVRFAYALRNDAFIDIPVQLAGTLAADDQPRNLTITYTDCESSGSSCLSRISGTNFTIEAGETAVFYGDATLENAPSSTDFAIRTSLLYTPDGIRKALYVGETASVCTGPVDEPVATATETRFPTATAVPSNTPTALPTLTATKPVTITETPTDIPTEMPSATPTEIPTSEPSATPTDLPTAEPSATSTEIPTAEPSATPTEIPTEVPSATPTEIPTEVPSATPTEIPTAEPSATPTLIPQPDLQPESAILDITANSAAYSRCGSDPTVRFILTMRNNGTAAGTIQLSDLKFTSDGKNIKVDFTGCTEMTSAGSNSETCTAGLDAGKIEIDPDVSIRLEAEYKPAKAIEAESILISVSGKDLNADTFEFEARSTGDQCEPFIETIPGSDGSDISAKASESGHRIDLSLRLINSGSGAAEIIPGTIYFHSASIRDYRGAALIEPMITISESKDAILVSSHEPFTIPARSSADISVSIDTDPTSIQAEKAALAWNFTVNQENVNYRGVVTFPRNTVNTSEPEAEGSSTFYSISDPQIPELLPATGFSGRDQAARYAVQPGSLAYHELNGLHLEIPVIEASMEILGIPVDDKGEWAVRWLKDEAGILDGQVLPGEGTALIAAHNHLDETHAGPFAALWQLENQDRLFITDNSGEMLRYKVYANELVRPNDSRFIFEKAIPGSLVLMTCEEEMPEGGYAYRRLIFAEPLQ